MNSDVISDEISNSLVILMADVVFNVNTNQGYDSIKAMNQIGIMDVMLSNFNNGMLANDYDNLGFLIQISSRLLTHLGKEDYPKERVTEMVIGFLNRILSKKQVYIFFKVFNLKIKIRIKQTLIIYNNKHL